MFLLDPTPSRAIPPFPPLTKAGQVEAGQVVGHQLQGPVGMTVGLTQLPEQNGT